MVLTPAHIATADGIGQTNFALEVLTKIMPIYEDMFDIEFPLPKLDILAVSVVWNILYQADLSVSTGG